MAVDDASRPEPAGGAPWPTVAEVQRRVKEAMATWQEDPFGAGQRLNDLSAATGLSIWQMHRIAPLASAPTMENLGSLARLPPPVRALVGMGGFTRSNAQVFSRYFVHAPMEDTLRAARSLIKHPMPVHDIQSYGAWYVRTGKLVFPEDDADDGWSSSGAA